MFHFDLKASSTAPLGRDACLKRAGPRQPNFKLVRFRLCTLLAVLDAVAVTAGFALSNALWWGSPLAPLGVNNLTVLWPVYLCIALNNGAYSSHALSAPRTGTAHAACAMLLAVLAVVSLLFTLKVSEDFSRAVFGLGSVASLTLIVIGRQAAGHWIGVHYGWVFRKDLLILDGLEVEPSAGEIAVSAEAADISPSSGDPIMFDRIGQLLADCDRLVLACAPERRTAWARMLKGADVDVEIVVPELDNLGALGLRRHGGRSTLLVASAPLSMADRCVKRALDLAVASAALLLLLPIMLAVGIAVRLDSPGPVMFRQARTGLGNRIFLMIKFRSMRVETADAAGSRSARHDDDRLTRIGAFLRRTSLDELPQLINVLRGEMSIVGPRPHPLGCTAEDRLFWEIDARYWDRHATKPGMTGLAQVRGHRGATAKCSDLTNRLQADLEYLVGWNVGRDITIMFRTLLVMVHRNAF